MRNRKKDYNQIFARCEEFCKHGPSPGATAYLPIRDPVAHKIRVAELYARYKLFPVRIYRNEHFPEAGLCIIFIPFTYGLLGCYDAVTSRDDKAFLQYWIHHKALKRDEMIYRYPTE